LVEHTAENRGVAGSIPALAIIDRSPPPPRGGMTTSIDSFSCRPTARADAGRADIGGDCDDVRAHASSEGATDEVSNLMDRRSRTSVGAYVAQRSRWARPDPRGCARLRWSRADFPKNNAPSFSARSAAFLQNGSLIVARRNAIYLVSERHLERLVTRLELQRAAGFPGLRTLDFDARGFGRRNVALIWSGRERQRPSRRIDSRRIPSGQSRVRPSAEARLLTRRRDVVSRGRRAVRDAGRTHTARLRVRPRPLPRRLERAPRLPAPLVHDRLPAALPLPLRHARPGAGR
jgi:hypothetical protein